MRTMGTLITGTALLVAPAAMAWADCAPMTVQSVPETRDVHFADLDASGGPSRGDKRVGEYGRRTPDGTTVGKIYWAATVNEVDADQKPTGLQADMVLVFDDGALFMTNAKGPAERFANTQATVVPSRADLLVVGGTGAYATASGTATATFDKLDFEFVIDMACE